MIRRFFRWLIGAPQTLRVDATPRFQMIYYQNQIIMVDNHFDKFYELVKDYEHGSYELRTICMLPRCP